MLVPSIAVMRPRTSPMAILADRVVAAHVAACAERAGGVASAEAEGQGNGGRCAGEQDREEDQQRERGDR